MLLFYRRGTKRTHERVGQDDADNVCRERRVDAHVELRHHQLTDLLVLGRLAHGAEHLARLLVAVDHNELLGLHGLQDRLDRRQVGETLRVHVRDRAPQLHVHRLGVDNQ